MQRASTLTLALLACSGCLAQQQRYSGTLNVPGSLFRYTAEGKGPPVVVFTGSENIGQRLYTDRLREHVTIIHADPDAIRGEQLEKLSMFDVVEDIERVRRAIGVEKIGVMGHSMFGPVPLEYALQYPERTSFSIITGAVPFTTQNAFHAADEYWETQASADRKAIRAENHRALAQIDRSGKSPTEQFWDTYEADVPLRFFDPRFDLRPFRLGLTTEVNMDFVARFAGVLLKDFDRTHDYARVRTPVLIIAGKYDFGAPYFLWENVATQFVDHTFYVFDQAGHNPMLERPDEFDRLVIEWIGAKK